MNTVQREPRLTGAVAVSPSWANFCTVKPIAVAKVSMNEPQPEEQASLSMMLSIAPFRMRKHLMSCPPMSKMKSTSGWKCFAAV